MLRSNSTYEGSCYTSDNTAKWIAAGILYKSYSLFTEARVIKNLEMLLSSSGSTDPEVQNDFAFALNNVFLDKISILTAFEYIIKAKLLLNGYIIHKVDHRIGNGKFIKLYKKQLTAPLKVEEILIKEGIDNQKQAEFVFEALETATLEMPLLLEKQSYLRPTALPEKPRSVLQKFLKDERTLQYLAPREHYGSVKNLQNFEILNKYVSSEIIDEYNKLATEMEYPNSQLIRRA